MSNTDFIKKIAPDAQKMYANYKILASLIIAQGCLESAYGNSGLAVNGKNLFGMKGEYNGQYVIMKTWEVINGQNVQVDAKFRKYPSWSESIQDLANLYLKGTSWDPNHYKAVVGETNYKKATAALVNAGYATDPSYATKLNNIIETYSLTKYDAATSAPTSDNPVPVPSTVGGEEVDISVDAYSSSVKIDSMGSVPITDGNFRILYKNGTVIDMARNLSVLVRSFKISAPDPEIEYETIPGRNGSLRMGKTFGKRTITAECIFFGADNPDFHLLQAELFHALYKDDEYFLISEAMPKKRWRVELSSAFTPDRMGSTGEFNLTFVSASTYCESVATTLSAFTFDSDMWQLGEGLTDETYKYKHDTNTFKIYNAGTVRIDPLELPLNISYKGASNKLQIFNKTTGDKWTYSGTSSASDTIKLTGVLARKGNTSIFGDTNHGLITLLPGWNEFVLAGTSGKFEITFDFRFYYFA
ncbi:phage tail family protein [Bacillus subtilis]|uniref:glucosaminidase domain-containing protein n=1 Tax=Bacillus subtilis TaxID=1423 RepID=UPI002DBF24CF|nr:glucosaminidase domain-containing protein [Bacillus subtilis]MEC2233901.1 phage tail family protein [Bacillus subtilis]